MLSGLVLTALSGPFLEGAFGRAWAIRAPVHLLREWHNHPAHPDEQVGYGPRSHFHNGMLFAAHL